MSGGGSQGRAATRGFYIHTQKREGEGWRLSERERERREREKEIEREKAN